MRKPNTQEVTLPTIGTATLFPPSVSGGSIQGPVSLGGLNVELGLGGIYHDILVNEAYVQGYWPLSELIGDAVYDQCGLKHDGSLVGSGIERGIEFSLPEGALGTQFDGNGYIRIEDTGDPDFSLAAGDIDISFLIKTNLSTSDNKLYGLVVKQTGDAATNGWHVGLFNGQIWFRLNVGGLTVFSMQRGSVADGQEHLINCCYETTGVGARIFIDGVQSGAAVAASTEPAATTAPVVIGVMGHLADGFFIGSLSNVMIGREGDPTLASRLQATREWTNVTSDVRMSDAITMDIGSRGSGALDRLSSTGTLSFIMDNSDENSGGLVGYYSPDHANCRTGFGPRIPVRLRCQFQNTTVTKFWGFLNTITPVTGIHGALSVQVTAVDWMNEAAEQFLGSLATLSNVQSDDVIRHILTRADRRPVRVSIGVGDSKFLYAIDNATEDTTILQELQRTNTSEFGWTYVKCDGTFVFEGRTKRRGISTNAYVFSKHHGVDVTVDPSTVFNTVKATVYPRQVQTEGVLYTLQNSQQLNPNEEITIEAPYKDPNERASRVGASDVQTPAANIDYTMFSAVGGGGQDLTANLQVTIEKGASKSTLTLKNNGNSVGFINKLQVRGIPILTYDPFVVKDDDATSVRKFRRRTITLDMPYQSYHAYAHAVVEQLLSVGATAALTPRAINIYGNESQDLMQQCLVRDIGDRIGISDQVSGISTSGSRGYFISGIRFVIAPERQVQATFSLSVSDQIPDLQNQILYTGPETGSADVSLAPLVLTVPGEYEFTIQRGMRLRIKGVAGGGAGSRGSVDATSGYGGGGGGGGAVHASGIVVEIGDVGTWKASIGAGGTYDAATTLSSDGSDTWFEPLTGDRILHLQGGKCPVGGVSSAAGLGGAVIIGAGGVGGSNGGRGKQQNIDGNGVQGDSGADNLSGAAGGAGSGSPNSSPNAGGTGGEGGDGASANGAAGGIGNANGPAAGGSNSSGGGGGGANGASASGGGGGGGGITLHASATNRGGGGGGGGGARTGMWGGGGNGSNGVLIIELA